MTIIQCKIDGQTLFMDRQGFWQLHKDKAVRMYREEAEDKVQYSGAVKAMTEEGGIVSLEHV